MTIPFNKPHLSGNETAYIQQAVAAGKISGDGMFTKKCHQYFEHKYRFSKTLLTTSCTDALEMAAILIDIRPGDEIIMPAYTFVSTANAFALRGAKIVFADSYDWHPNMDAAALEQLVTDKTKAIVPVHYAGVACDMDAILDIARRNNLYVIEDAAQAIDSYYTGVDGQSRSLGSIGQLAAFSFHETKNIISGEGGLLAINDERFAQRAEIIREKGTNRSAFFRGEVDKYGWVDIGSSFLPSDIIAAFLYAQLENLEGIQERRVRLWERYYNELKPLSDAGHIQLPVVPAYATNNGHMFYITVSDLDTRSALIAHCKKQDIHPVFHYLSLNKSPFYTAQGHATANLTNSDHFTDTLLRLPLFYSLTEEEQDKVVNTITSFYQ